MRVCVCVNVTITDIQTQHNKCRTPCYCEFFKVCLLDVDATEQHAPGLLGAIGPVTPRCLCNSQMKSNKAESSPTVSFFLPQDLDDRLY